MNGAPIAPPLAPHLPNRPEDRSQPGLFAISGFWGLHFRPWAIGHAAARFDVVAELLQISRRRPKIIVGGFQCRLQPLLHFLAQRGVGRLLGEVVHLAGISVIVKEQPRAFQVKQFLSRYRANDLERSSQALRSS